MRDTKNIFLLVLMLVICSACDGIEDTSKLYTSSWGNNKYLSDSKRVPRPNKAHKISVFNLRREFNDLNDEQLAAAKKIGTKPIKDRNDIAGCTKPLYKIDEANDYIVDDLTHSSPLLVKEGAQLLSKIAANFRDSLVVKHLPDYRIIVTSVLRTDADIKKLRKVNVNSSENSAHRFGTTIDIAYNKFANAEGEFVRDNICVKLKSVLAEVLRDLRNQKECYVKYEVKQACFHITARP